jgi:hypothetical protein
MTILQSSNTTPNTSIYIVVGNKMYGLEVAITNENILITQATNEDEAVQSILDYMIKNYSFIRNDGPPGSHNNLLYKKNKEELYSKINQLILPCNKGEVTLI